MPGYMLVLLIVYDSSSDLKKSSFSIRILADMTGIIWLQY